MSIISESKTRQVQTLNELSKRKVVEHNSLITSIAKMDKTPLKMFELAVSLIDTENPPQDQTVYLSKRELFAFFKVNDNDKHSRFKQAIERMQKQAFFQIKKEHDKGFKFVSIVPIPYVEWTDYNDEVKIEFHREIMPYLINLKNNFTQHALSDIAELNSKYAIILYRWLSMNYNQYEHYSFKGGRRQDQIDSYRNPEISIRDLREMTDTIDEYLDFRNFEKRILKNGIEEITNHTTFNVTYEKVKKGRSIDSIVFHITKKQVADDSSYKQDDPVYIEGKIRQEETEDMLTVKAIKSPYTKLLMEQFLLSYIDLTDTTILSGLQKNVYPLYDELKELRGLKGVKEHLAYIRDKQDDYSKKNIAKYLKKSIEQYLPIVKRQDIDHE
ncbi:RepB family plasmid replication initiator protein [Leuconostoc mesenteroides]|uniref:RepB family plasmid replication initiator protein n=2 Tax=Leuconostoc mesenteroides TaxID=1245 RepID=UPI000A068FC5|nr:RepB family plasmid replication initiator protein [Leuconostoc mesenteroides]MBZ1517260.1 RepB family plasmid replication initiator protein [Leuconostoc mesenteroides]MBZ1541119.1 RepB family plasmid replication initiator protein [Leuconostoc mesenteroides]MCP9302674.1 RepB family plasmid replication initiator protein [Leuconostoc mesenteroides]MCP9327044.1 RepB family plasmid replication initiator protein [Leuconostoc mesenteroides]ORI79341.1 RepB protein [Leuconostoc mesenteroides subsp. 